jgi:plastocyanin
MADDDFDIELDRSQLGTGVVAGVVAYVVGFIISFLPGPIANPRVYRPNDVINATINTTERPGVADSPFPPTETIDSLSSAAGVFYNAHFVDVIVNSQRAVLFRSNVLLAEQANTTTGFGTVSGNDLEIVLAGLPIPPILLFATPVVLLAAAGYLLNERSRDGLPTPESAIASGSAVVLGYLPLAAVIASMIRFRHQRIIFGSIDLVGAILIAGVVYPVTFGGLGGYVWHVARRREDESASEEASTTGSVQPEQAPGGEPPTAPAPGAERAGGTPAGTTTRVAMTDELAFGPPTVTIAAGDTVEWENAGSLTFTVTAYEERIPPDAAYFASGGFDAEAAAREAYPDGGIGSGDSYAHTFRTPGTYEYFCVPQEGAGMTGTVEVRER